MSDTAKYANAFKLVDANGDGVISAGELQKMMAQLGEEVSDERAAQMVQALDGDGDGGITLAEFAAFMSNPPPA